MNKNKLRIALVSIISCGSLAFILPGCSSSSNNNSTPTNGGNAGVGGSPSATGGSAETGGTTSDDTSISSTGGASDMGGASGSGGTSGTGGTTGAACVPDTSKACYSCPASSNDQFLNHCSDATCQKFDNTAKGVPATLPAIP